MNPILNEVRDKLLSSVDEKTKSTTQRFFKEKIRAYGVKVTTVSKIAQEYFRKVEDKSKDEVFQLCEELFKSGILEESFVACKWSDCVKEYEEKDFKVFDMWIDTYVDNWATCDTLCNHTVGSFIVAYPEYVERLIEWTCSENRWKRRGAAVSLVVPAKKGLFLVEAFRIADSLMGDKEDLVQKGFGWLLKEESRTKQGEVYEYVLSKRAVMPRTALRYAIELMPQDMRKEAMRRIN